MQVMRAAVVLPAAMLFSSSTMLPRAGDDTSLWLPSWLLCHTREGANGRMFTEFNWGSELT